MIKPEPVIASFYQVINDQPELFQGEAAQDLPSLEMALDEAEHYYDQEQLEAIADAIIDFCDSNPDVDQAVQAELEHHLNETLSAEVLPALTQTVDSLIEKQEKALLIATNLDSSLNT